MTARQYLNQIKKNNSLIRRKKERLAFWEHRATDTAVNYSGEKVQSSGDKHSMEKAAISASDIALEIRELEKANEAIIRTLEKIEDVEEFEVLYEIYMNDRPMLKLEEMFDRSYSWIAMKHRNGLASLQKILDRRRND